MTATLPVRTVKAPAQKILLAGLLVGTLDILSAFVDYYIATGKGPAGVLNYVASGVFGKDALADNGSMWILGLLFHYIIAIAFTFFFFWLYPKLGIMGKNRVITAFVYGLFIWIVMNLVVVRLSNAPHAPLSAIKPLKALKAYLILAVMIGMPLSFIAYKFYYAGSKKETPGNS